MAYRGIQKKGLQKKLDERALKNQEFYQKLDKQVEEAQKKMNLKALREEHKALSDFIGQCPLSVQDLFESMEQGTCMCLGLEVERSEACIADPTLVKIKKIIPTFFAGDSFIDSAVFSLKVDPNAHGGFQKHGQTNQNEG